MSLDSTYLLQSSVLVFINILVNPYEYGAEATLLELFAFTFLAQYLNQENLFFADYSNYLLYILLKFYILLRLLSYS